MLLHLFNGAVEDRKGIVTLLGYKQSREGFKFIFNGSSDLCPQCERRKVCLENLEEGRVYEVIEVHKNKFPCAVHGEVCVVKVVESDIEAAVPVKMAIEGSVIAYNPQDCSDYECSNFHLCIPKGLVKGDKCKIMEVREPLKCPLNRSLVEVLLRRVHVAHKTPQS